MTGFPDERSVRQILLARFYLHLAAEQIRSQAEPAKFAAINLYHEALEATLITCADHLNANVPEKSSIELYLDRINKKLDGTELPFRSRIIQFNKARVAAKHHLTLPDESFLNLVGTVVPEFVQSTIRLTFGKDLEEISLVDLIEDQEVAGFISESQNHLVDGDAYSSLTSARKAFYVQFEKPYDVREFIDPAASEAKGILSAFSLCSAPYYAKNPEYIQKNISRPSDYIVWDHSKIESELMKEGIDLQVFWNIWRLTPQIYRNEGGEWLIEYDFDIADDPQIKENCLYVIDSLISITLQRQSRRKQSRSRTGAHRYIQTVPNAAFYTKAKKGSEVVGRLPDGIRRVNIDRAVPALDGNGFYWQASYLRKHGPFLFGFVNAEDTEGEPEFGFIADGTDIAHAIPGALSERDAPEDLDSQRDQRPNE